MMISYMWLHIFIILFIGTLDTILAIKGFSPQKSGKAHRQAKGFLSIGPLMVEVLLDYLDFRNRRNTKGLGTNLLQWGGIFLIFFDFEIV